VVTVAFGSEAGAPVPQGDGWLRDRNGTPVRSRRDGETLRALASLTDGAAFEADAWGEVDVAVLAAELRRDAGASAGEAGRRRVPAVRVAPFALLGFLLLASEFGSPGRHWRPRRSQAHAGAAATATLLALALLAPGEPFAAPDSTDEVAAVEAHLRGHPGDPRALLALGLARAERGQRAGAERAFRAAALLARDDGLAALAYYDLGVAALERGALDEARDAFFDAVALDPQSPRALHNLEWTLAALAARRETPPPPKPRPESSGERGRPELTPQSEGREGDRATRPRPASLDPDEVRRWLDQAEDDPRRGLRADARESGPRPSRGPAW
jgi:tetratricopeptide (TPR) repeat protein